MSECCIIERGAIHRVVDFVRQFNATKVFLVGDRITFPLAGEAIREELEQHGIECVAYCFSIPRLEPNESAMGSLCFHYKAECDLIIGVGSGVVDDLCKILAHQTGNPYIIVATAPSIDGYASSSSAMVCDGMKVTIPSKCGDVIIADIDILAKAPLDMLKAGFGDMLAKYISLCDWRIAHLIAGETYNEEVAAQVRCALKKCVVNADGVLNRDEEAIRAVFEGLIITGQSMKKAGVSRPASGTEHSMSHLWDMRGIEFGTPVNRHGIQCAIATYVCVQLYQKIKQIIPNRDKALQYVSAFSVEEWNSKLREFLGNAAESMIELEKREKKYNAAAHEKRLAVILEQWDRILTIIDEEIPVLEEFHDLILRLNMPMTLGNEPMDKKTVVMSVKAAKDIRDKYLLPRLLWDIGMLDELCDEICL